MDDLKRLDEEEQLQQVPVIADQPPAGLPPQPQMSEALSPLNSEEAFKQMMADRVSQEREYDDARKEADRKLLYINLAKAANKIGTSLGTPNEKVDNSFYDEISKQAENPIRDVERKSKFANDKQQLIARYLMGKNKMANDASKSETDLRTEYLKQSQLTPQMETHYKNVEKAAKAGTAASDVSLTFAVMKLYDPNSSVREGETATVANTGSIPSKIWQMFNAAQTGQRLSPEVRADFLRTARDRMNVQYQAQDALDNYYKNIISKKQGVDPEQIILKRTVNLDQPSASKHRAAVKTAPVKSVSRDDLVGYSKKHGISEEEAAKLLTGAGYVIR